MAKKKEAPPLFIELSEQFKPSNDIIQTPLHIQGQFAFLFFLKSVVDGDRLQQTVIRPFFELSSEENYASYIQSLPNKLDVPDKDKLIMMLSAGFVLVAIEDNIFSLDIRLVKNNEVQQTLMEPTIHGPQLALSEDIEVTINIIRQRYHKSSLNVIDFIPADETNRAVVLLYDNDRADPDMVKKVKKRLDELHAPLFQSAGDLQRLLNKGIFTLLPSTLITERPDRIVYNLHGGKVIIVIDGSPNVIITPVIFFDFMSSMEDNYHVFGVTGFTILLRYIGLLTCIILPSLYVAMTSYNPDILRIELALTVAGSRIGVPYPSFIEVIFMLFFMELLTEASMRLPKAVSATATTVGGLILGTAATEAALTSTIMIIIISAVAISTFVIPINEMSFAMRVIRLFLLIYTSLFGLVGLLVGFIGIIMVFANKESYGVPYLRIPWMNKNEELRMDNK
ncbi:spore germination protein [Lederbergia lenta]|uniref:Spore germination protein GerLA n=1 Tax=Lederbergia lenta TaxID=1467 RepID=A0A2X4VQC7_LEDLE|nr:spore germination protein [Lederbergia lenta]MEC2323616.1 spore germination protein [Lederbergia lenta]SQI52449.1 spore germination protein GerLA [Lederbergia lenta]